ncbi:ribose-phosphate pyrophosphokinase, partial [Halomonas sp. FL8]|nr:ribose-phosphate pyrophosphokinase [Halomonas sp. FL8]
HGANRVVAYATHAILSGPAVDNISGSVLDELVVADTIPLSELARRSGKIRQLSVAGLIAEAIRRVSNEESVSAMFH